MPFASEFSPNKEKVAGFPPGARGNDEQELENEIIYLAIQTAKRRTDLTAGIPMGSTRLMPFAMTTTITTITTTFVVRSVVCD